MPVISVIVPVYNAGAYLGDALKSLIDQTFADFEVIVVNDGSADHSGQVAEAYAQTDKRINVYHQENRGVSAARNLAIEKAKGQYLMFVDADDWVDKNMMSDILHQISSYGDVDLVRLTNQKVYSREKTELPEAPYVTQLYKLEDFFKEGLLGGYVSSLFVKRGIVDKGKLRFSLDMKLMEDQEFSNRCVLNSRKILFYNKPHYFYYQQPLHSAVQASSIKNHRDILACGLSTFQYWRELGLPHMERKVKTYCLSKLSQFMSGNLRNGQLLRRKPVEDVLLYLQQIEVGFWKMGPKNLVLFFLLKYTSQVPRHSAWRSNVLYGKIEN